MSKRDYYCNQKFNWQSVNVSDGVTFSCCSAEPYKLNLQRLKDNKNELFNFPEIVKDRQDMLDNKRVSGCEYCWKEEDRGVASRRTQHGRSDKTHTDLFQLPEKLHVLLSSDCNQACVYCNTLSSTTWGRIVNDNQDLYNSIEGYGDNYKINVSTKAKLKLGQKKVYKSAYVNEILTQIKNNSSRVRELTFSGGEPMLDNNFISILRDVSSCDDIRIMSGLSVSLSRIKKIIAEIKDSGANVNFRISAENIGTLHEFNRYGSVFAEMEEKYYLLKEHFPIEFTSTIGCTTAFGFGEFCKYFKEEKIVPHHVSYPDMMLLSNLDPESKEIFKEEWQDIRHIVNVDDYIIMLDKPAMKTRELKHYLDIYAKTRNLNLNVFPQRFLDFLQQKG